MDMGNPPSAQAVGNTNAKPAVTNKQFIHALLDVDVEGAWLCSVPGDPGDENMRSFWHGGSYRRMVDAVLAEHNNFFAAHVVKAGSRNRGDDNYEATRVIVVDDVGQKADAEKVKGALGDPTWVLETSPGCFQWGYKLAERVADRRVAQALYDGLAALGLTDKGTAKTGQYFRLPEGINGKAKYRGAHPAGFKVQLREWAPARVVGVAELAKRLGVDLGEAALLAGSISRGSLDKGTADLASPDQWLGALLELGLVKGAIGQGKVDITCPWVGGHSQGDNGSAYLGDGLFKCHHGHCAGHRSEDFQRRIREMICEEVTGGTQEGEQWQASRLFAAVDTGEARGVIERLMASREKAEHDKKRGMLSKYVFVRGLGRFVDTDTNEMLDRTGFQAANTRVAPFGSRGQASADAIFLNDGGRQVQTATYRPGEGALCKVENDAGVLVDAYNLWRKPAFKPARGVSDADVKLWLDHAALIFPDQVERDAALDWMAHVLQRPGVKINWALLVVGEMGTGKDTLFAPVIAAVGDSNVSQIQADTLRDSFTSFLKAQLVVVNEMAQVGGQLDTHNRMKSWLAAPPNKVLVNEKNLRPYHIPNTQCWLMFSNKEDAVPIEEGDRRHAVLLSPAKPRDAAYYDALWAYLRGGGSEKVAGWLLDRNLAGFNAAKPPLRTAGRAAMQRASLPNVQQWVVGEIEAGRFAGRKLVAVREFIDAAAARGNGVPGGVARDISPRHVQAALRHVRASPVREDVRMSDGRKLTIWATERAELYRQMDAAQLRDAYEKEAAAFGALGVVA